MKYLKQFEALNSEILFTEADVNDIKDAFIDIVDEWSLVRVDVKEVGGPDGLPENDISYEIKLDNFDFILTIQIFIPIKYKFEKNKFEKDCDAFIKRVNQMGFRSKGFNKNPSFFYEFWTTAIKK